MVWAYNKIKWTQTNKKKVNRTKNKRDKLIGSSEEKFGKERDMMGRSDTKVNEGSSDRWRLLSQTQPLH